MAEHQKCLVSLDVLQSAANTGSTIDFGSLSIGHNGSVSDSISANMLSNLSGSSNIFSSSSLNLNIINAVLNQGNISSVGNLALSAGSNITNQGNISSSSIQSRFRYW